MLKLEEISKSFGESSSNEKVIFEKFNLNVEKGEFVTIIGGNGCGKSTLMNLISGSVFPKKGNIFIDGKNVTCVSEYKRAEFIGRVFQDPLKGTAPNLTVEENLSLALLKGEKKGLKFSINKNKREFLKEKLKSLNLGLEDRLDAKIGLLSGGQRQAITLLMATLKKPKILLLDEHTAALDPKSSDKILELTNHVAKNSEITTLMITHDVKKSLEIGTRTIMLSEGKIALDLNNEYRKIMSSEKLQKLFDDTNS
ncbi:MAG: ABC transporter ATP-binding protein [Acutalibacteraceae bacterium]